MRLGKHQRGVLHGARVEDRKGSVTLMLNVWVSVGKSKMQRIQRVDKGIQDNEDLTKVLVIYLAFLHAATTSQACLLNYLRCSGEYSLSSSLHSKPISLYITRLISVAFDPFKQCLNLQTVALLNLCKDVFHKIFVFHCLARRGLPPVFTPINVP